MRKLFSNILMLSGQLKRERIVYAALMLLGLLMITRASGELQSTHEERVSAREEYELLGGLYPVMSAYLASQNFELPDSDSVPAPAGFLIPDSESEIPDFAGEQPDPLITLLNINPDFAGWIAIGDFINYPVVQGKNNSYYLNRTFSGQDNAAGAIFMDYRLAHGFDEPVCILFGHNMKDGTIFAPLHQYRDPAFIDTHPDITIVTAEGEVLTYRIFAARTTNAWDEAYNLDYSDCSPAVKKISGAPAEANRFLILSTCTSNSNSDERLLVYAARLV